MRTQICRAAIVAGWVCSIALLFSGCVGHRVAALSDKPLAVPTSASSVKLYEGDCERPAQNIAIVDSFRARKLDEATVRRMMEDLQAKAKTVGADAVIHVRRLRADKEGFVSNPRTPFPSVMQGKWSEYFFRGTAVKFTH